MILALLALLAGGVLKGATGVGAPLLAVPALAAIYDVRAAVAIMVVPNLISNAWQYRAFHGRGLDRGFVAPFALGGGAGVVAGSWALASLSPQTLSGVMAATLIGYMALRLARPDLILPEPLARRLALAAGFSGGALQGAAGISAPVSVLFLTAMRLPRPAFVATISAFFAVMSGIQVVALTGFGLLDLRILGLGLGATVALFLGMALGGRVGGRLSPQAFDRGLLVLLALLAVKLAWDTATG